METEELKKDNLEKENLALKNENLKMINRLLKTVTFPVEILKRIDAAIIKYYNEHQDISQNFSENKKMEIKMDPAKIWAVVTLICLILMCIVVAGSSGMGADILLLPGIPAFILVWYLIRDNKKK